MSNKETIQSALIHFKDKSLLDGSLAVLHSLGYKSDSDFSVDDSSFKGIQKLIKEQLQKEINSEKCISKDWVSFQFLFQFTPDDTNNLFKKEESSFKKIDSFFFATLDLKGDKYTRSELAAITREINKPFQMPVILLFRYGSKTDKQATLSVIDRRISKSKDPVKAQEHVLEKVSLIHNINLANPHRAHIEILNDLDLQALKNAYVIDNFIDLYDAWQKVLDTKELNRRFYRDIANWYFWAIGEVEYPEDVHKDRDIRNSLSVIRLLTRLIFVWFLKEKKIDGEKEFIPDAIFNEKHLKDILKNFMEKKGTGSSFYKAILQNLFFATLNTEIDADRRFRTSNGVEANDKDYLVHTLYRYENEFKEPKKVLEYFNNIPFLNGGLFECLDQRKEEADKGKGEIRIDCFTDHPKTQKKLVVPDFLFFGKEEVDLSEIYGDQKRKSERVEGIIHILRKYKFTVTENTPLEEDVALDPELLGRVFENLLASYNPETKATARKQTGSFYTPREIVNYMVDESLIAHFKETLAPPSFPPQRVGMVGEKFGWQTADLKKWEELKKYAREMRKDSTKAEELLWQELRNKKLEHKFRRQHAISFYIADFVCLDSNLIIEVDGEIHEFQKEKDEQRTKILNSLGFSVLRFRNEEIFSNLDKVVQIIKSNLPPLRGGNERGASSDIESKLRELVSYSEAQPFEKKETLILIDAINSMKILDPACGSGAFPMGILHKLVHVLQKLDPKNDEWKRIQIEHAKRTPDSTLRNHLIKEIESAFNEDKNRRDYGRKLYILKNCIYGVDIQPIAIEISKLRFFISLIVDQKANNARKDNFGIIPLPNLENNFVAANTLIALDKPKEATFGDHLLKEKEKELKDIRQQHFDARTYKEKQALRKKDKAKREEIAALLKQFGFPAKTASLVAAWNPYDRLKSSEWFDPEYMFEIHTGFDVVIGNPPYLRVQGIQQSQPDSMSYYKAQYKSAVGSFDLYALFVEKGYSLLNSKGFFSYILPHKFFQAKFGESIREQITKRKALYQIVRFGAEQVFEEATTYTCLLFLSAKPNDAFQLLELSNIESDLLTITKNRSDYKKTLIKAPEVSKKEWHFGETENFNLIDKLKANAITLGEITRKIFVGLQTGGDKIFILEIVKEKKTTYICFSKSLEEEIEIEKGFVKPFLMGKDVHRYEYLIAKNVVLFPYELKNLFGEKEAKLMTQKAIREKFPLAWEYLKRNKRELETREHSRFQNEWWCFSRPQNMTEFDSVKIMTPEIANKCELTIDVEGNLYHTTKVYSFVLKESFEKTLSIKYLIATLNSKILWY